MIIFLTALTLAAGIGYYFIIFKPISDEKISKKTKGKGTVATSIEPDDSYSEIINDYPTYDREVK